MALLVYCVTCLVWLQLKCQTEAAQGACRTQQAKRCAYQQHVALLYRLWCSLPKGIPCCCFPFMSLLLPLHLQKEALAAAGVELVLVGHGMNSDVEIAELYEIEWPQGMQTFDTQRLYMAWQLKQLNAGAAAKALAAVAGGDKGGSKAAAGLDDELQELYNDDSADEEAAGWVDDAMPNEGYEGLAAAAGKGMAALSLGKDHRGSPAGSVNSNSGSGANSPGGKAARKGKAQVQNPPRVRPWPAGPAPEDPSRPASSGEQQQQQCDQAVKVERQVSLAGLLSALGIKSSKLHNAGGLV